MGPAGLTGAQGPAGLSGFEVVSTMSPVAGVSSVSGFGLYTAVSSCPAGKHAIAGGYEAFGGATFMPAYASMPSTPQTWRVSLRNPDSAAQANVSVRVYVMCVNN
jgi:hypothetical protein